MISGSVKNVSVQFPPFYAGNTIELSSVFLSKKM
jgi:hypothetical protein